MQWWIMVSLWHTICFLLLSARIKYTISYDSIITYEKVAQFTFSFPIALRKQYLSARGTMCYYAHKNVITSLLTMR